MCHLLSIRVLVHSPHPVAIQLPPNGEILNVVRMPVTLSATIRKYMNYNTTRSSPTLTAACYDVDLLKHCYNTHTHTHTHTIHIRGKTDLSVRMKLRLR